MCPGSHLADNFLFILIASTLASFDILPEVDDIGRPVLPDFDYSPGLGGVWYV